MLQLKMNRNVGCGIHFLFQCSAGQPGLVLHGKFHPGRPYLKTTHKQKTHQNPSDIIVIPGLSSVSVVF